LNLIFKENLLISKIKIVKNCFCCFFQHGAAKLHTSYGLKQHVGLEIEDNAYGLMNFKTKEMHYGDKINSSYYLGLYQFRSWSR
jgi:hypothetical protein